MAGAAHADNDRPHAIAATTRNFFIGRPFHLFEIPGENPVERQARREKNHQPGAEARDFLSMALWASGGSFLPGEIPLRPPIHYSRRGGSTEVGGLFSQTHKESDRLP